MLDTPYLDPMLDHTLMLEVRMLTRQPHTGLFWLCNDHLQPSQLFRYVFQMQKHKYMNKKIPDIDKQAVGNDLQCYLKSGIESAGIWELSKERIKQTTSIHKP